MQIDRLSQISAKSASGLLSSFQNFSFQLYPNPPFPRIRSGHQLFQRPSPQKQFPSNNIPALVLGCVATTTETIINTVELVIPNSDVLTLICISVMILKVVFISMLHYKCWMALPASHRFTTPGKAVEFLFIPFYNFYWAFLSWPKLSEGLVSWEQAERITPTDARSLGLPTPFYLSTFSQSELSRISESLLG